MLLAPISNCSHSSVSQSAYVYLIWFWLWNELPPSPQIPVSHVLHISYLIFRFAFVSANSPTLHILHSFTNLLLESQWKINFAKQEHRRRHTHKYSQADCITAWRRDGKTEADWRLINYFSYREMSIRFESIHPLCICFCHPLIHTLVVFF